MRGSFSLLFETQCHRGRRGGGGTSGREREPEGDCAIDGGRGMRTMFSMEEEE